MTLSLTSVLLIPLAADSVEFVSGKSISDEFRKTVNLLMTLAARLIAGAHFDWISPGFYHRNMLLLRPSLPTDRLTFHVWLVRKILFISGKVIGRRKPLFADWSIPTPPEWNEDGDGGLTLRDLIERIVREEVAGFKKRQYDRQFLRALTATEIEQAAEKGKIEMGGSEIGLQSVDEDQSIATALQAFDDGMYLVVIDEDEKKNLDEQIFLSPDSRVTFIRLTLLSGG